MSNILEFDSDPFLKGGGEYFNQAPESLDEELMDLYVTFIKAAIAHNSVRLGDLKRQKSSSIPFKRGCLPRKFYLTTAIHIAQII